MWESPSATVKYNTELRFNIEMKLRDELKHCLLCLDVLDEVRNSYIGANSNTSDAQLIRDLLI